MSSTYARLSRTALKTRRLWLGILGASCLSLAGCFLAPNLPPTAHIVMDATEGDAPLFVQFDATSSVDDDGVIARYQWTFGDGVTSTAMRPNHTYIVPGSYAIELTVFDDDGMASSTSRTLVVHKPNTPPAAAFTTTPSAAVPGERVQFDARESRDGEGMIVSYQWNFGDETTGQGETTEHAFSNPGTYTVTLRVIDQDGGEGVLEKQILIADPSPASLLQLETSTTSLIVGEALTCRAILPSEAASTTTCEWDFGDGTRAEGTIAQHLFVNAGTYRITLIVRYPDGAIQSLERSITVRTPSEPPAPPATEDDVYSLSFGWSYGGSRRLSLEIPTALYETYRSKPRGVWNAEGYSRFVLDPSDDDLMEDLRDSLLVNNSYQSTIENALAFVQQAISYQPDPGGTEYPRYPVETLVDGMGDCEDSAILYASIVRAFGYSAGVLLISVDTSGDGVIDHIAVLVRVADCFINAYPNRSLWEISGKTYAFAETAVTGGTLALGIDPWGIEQGDIKNIWNAADPTQQLRASRHRP